MMSQEQILSVAAGLIALTFGVVAVLGKRVWDNVMGTIDRVPSKEWFDGVKDSVDCVPEKEWFTRVESKLEKVDPERMQEHYARVHSLGNTAMANSMGIERVAKQTEDHEHRIRDLEGKKNGG